MILNEALKKLLTKTTKSNKRRCIVCQQLINETTNSFIFADLNLCRHCFNHFPFIYKRFKIDNHDALVIYQYDATIRKMILELKANADIEMAKVFLTPIREFLKCQYSGFTILPVPSIDSQNCKRGFNHLIEIVRPLELPLQNVFYKAKNWKQSNQKKNTRSQIRKVIKIRNITLNPNKKYLLVDDIMTTGESLKACLRLLDSFLLTKVNVLVISSNCRKG